MINGFYFFLRQSVILQFVSDFLEFFQKQLKSIYAGKNPWKVKEFKERISKPKRETSGSNTGSEKARCVLWTADR